MTVENPYRAAGAFAGKAYIRRGADAELVEQIRDNQYYPYFAAPRQSGKSSLIARTMASLDPAGYRCALVDLSPFVVRSYDDFWRQFLHEVARSANLDPTPIGKSDPREVFLAWLGAWSGRLVVFIDEIDVLLHVDCREQIFSKLRTFFNLRAHEPALRRLQFVLAGAAHSSRFISDPRWSPFNVAVEIALEDLSAAQVSQLASYLATAGAFAGPDLVARVYERTGGSVFLCQLVFEALWNRAARGKSKLAADDVDAVIESIVAESPRNIHFYNIFRLVTQDARLAMLFRRMVDGEELGEEDRKELQLTGLCRGMNPFRNDVYARVFGAGGPLDLKVAGAKVELGRKLEAALSRRQHLQDTGEQTSEVEAEIATLKREFREGAKLREGDVLGRGRYRLIGRIGEGGFATVWRGRDEQQQREVAIKVLHGQFAEDKTRRDRFFRGAWKMAELRHPGVVQVVEPYGEEGGRHYFVMEYMAGGTLHEAVLDKKLAPAAVISTIVAIGKALAHAHERGLVHRDVKPTNVMLTPQGAAKLTDFDLVREQDAGGSTRTGPMGSFIYAAPEAMNRPQDADHRADVYGLAMTAVFALHGADLPLDVVRDADRFIDRLHCGGLAKDVLKKGVAWELERRFRSVEEFTAALATSWAAKESDEPSGVISLPVRGAALALGAAAGAAAARRVARDEAAKAAEAEASASMRASATGSSASMRAPAAGESGSAAAGTVVLAAVAAAAPAADEAARAAVPAEQAAPARPAAPTTGEDVAPARAPTAESQAAPPTAERRSRGWLAVWGVLASAALVLIALQIGGSEGEGRLGTIDGSLAASQDVGGAPGVAIEGKKDSSTPSKSNDKKDTADASATTKEPPPTSEDSAATSTTGATSTTSTTSTTGAEAASEHDAAGGSPLDRPPERTSEPRVDPPPETKQAAVPISEQIEEGCRQVSVGDATVGVEALKKLFDDRPRDIKLLGCLGQGLMKLGDYFAAEHFFTTMVKQYPRHRLGYQGAGQAAELSNRPERAAYFYEKLLAIDPENRSARAFFAGQGARPVKPAGLDPLR